MWIPSKSLVKHWIRRFLEAIPEVNAAMKTRPRGVPAPLLHLAPEALLRVDAAEVGREAVVAERRGALEAVDQHAAHVAGAAI